MVLSEWYNPENWVKWDDVRRVITDPSLKKVFGSLGASDALQTQLMTASKVMMEGYGEYNLHLRVPQDNVDSGEITLTEIGDAILGRIFTDGYKIVKTAELYYNNGVRFGGSVTTHTPEGTETETRNLTDIVTTVTEDAPINSGADSAISTPKDKAKNTATNTGTVTKSFTARKDTTETITNDDRDVLMKMPDLREQLAKVFDRITWEFT